MKTMRNLVRTSALALLGALLLAFDEEDEGLGAGEATVGQAAAAGEVAIENEYVSLTVSPSPDRVRHPRSSAGIAIPLTSICHKHRHAATDARSRQGIRRVASVYAAVARPGV